MVETGIVLTADGSAQTAALGESLGRLARAGDVVLLDGEFGAGKTVFARGVAAGLGVEDEVSSPSFALVHEYAVPAGRGIRRLYHLDLYRLASPADVRGLGLDDYLNDDAVVVVEWPAAAAGALPADALTVAIGRAGEDRRRIRAGAGGPRSTALLAAWRDAVGCAVAAPTGGADRAAGNR